MKKLFLLAIMCLMCTFTFAKNVSSFKKCVVHYSRLILDEFGNQIGYMSYDVTADTCEEAIIKARLAGDKVEKTFF